MIAFEVKDMTCGHCVSAITQAIEQADPGARVSVDLPSHRVTIEPVRADANALQSVLAEAGYTPVPAAAAVQMPGAGSCCGQCH